MWGRQSYRWSDFDFEANAKDGIAIDWPIRYAEIAPWYDHVERHAGISGSHENLPQLPDGQFQPAMPLNCGEELVAGRLKKLYDGHRRLIIGRTANSTKALPGRNPCQYRNACWLGCPFGAYFSTQSSTLPAAMKTGRVTLKPWSIVTEVLFDKDKNSLKKASPPSLKNKDGELRPTADPSMYRITLPTNVKPERFVVKGKTLLGKELPKIEGRPAGN